MSWNTSVWNVSRWQSVSVADALLQPPIPSGLPTGQGDWSIVVEILLPRVDAGIWGIGVWNSSEWASIGWVDITDRLRGMEWRRGSDEVFGRPRVGTIALTLENNDGALDPWTAVSAQFLAPGTVLRCGLVSPTGIVDVDYGTTRWIPQWTGIVEQWAPRIATSNVADRYVEVRLNETVRDLAQIDDPALSVAVGSGESSADRFQRLLDAASWKYGLMVEAQNVLPGGYPLQSTLMAQNRLAELYLTADSSDSQFRSMRDGRAAVTASEYIGANSTDADPVVWPLVLSSWYETAGIRFPVLGLFSSDSISDDFVFAAYRPESFQSLAQDVEISNAVTLQRVGGVEQTFRQLASIERYGQRSFVRRDLLNDTGQDATVALLAQYVSIRRALTTLRVEAVTIDTWARPLRQFLSVVSVEPTDRALIYSPLGGDPLPSISGYVASIVHRVSPRVSGSSVVWETDVRIDSRIVNDVPGAQLPETPA